MTSLPESPDRAASPARSCRLAEIPVRSVGMPAAARGSSGGGSACGTGHAATAGDPGAESGAGAGCEEGGLFALQVLGDAMAPEFDHGDIIVAEADGALADGAFVVARSGEEWVLRQLKGQGADWRLVALNPAWPETPVDLAAVRGVVIQKSRPGRRRSLKRYV